MSKLTKAAIGWAVAPLLALCAAIPVSVALAMPASAAPTMTSYPQSPVCVDSNNNFVCDADESVQDVPDDFPPASPPSCVPSEYGCPGN